MVRPVFKNVRGFTLIEVIVVLAVAGVVAVLALKSLGGGGKDQSLVSAQREFLTALRGAQNRVLNGANGASFEVVTVNASSYVVGNVPKNLPPGITVTSSSPTYICFANSLLTSYSLNQCGGCSAGAFFSCYNGTKTSSGAIEIVFDNGGSTKKVVVEGLNMAINRVYAQ